MSKKNVWYKVLDNISDLPEGRVKTVTAGHQTIALTHFDGKYNALAPLLNENPIIIPQILIYFVDKRRQKLKK